MIVKITNISNHPDDNAWTAETRDGSVHHNCGADYFPAAAIAATPNEGDAVYCEATMNVEAGELRFGPPSNVEAFNAS